MTCTPIDFPDAVMTMALGINDPGHITGVYKTESSPSFQVFLQFTTIDYPDPQTCETLALGINNLRFPVSIEPETGS